MDIAMLRADCASCAGLCCVVLAFDRSPQFAHDKAAGTPCVHLNTDCRCRIHASRARLGFAGCVSYDCLGAGQRATAMLSGGHVTASEQSEVFSAIHHQHQVLVLLHTAASLPLSIEHSDRCAALEQQARAADLRSAAGRRAFLTGPIPKAIRAYLLELRPNIEARQSDRSTMDLTGVQSV